MAQERHPNSHETKDFGDADCGEGKIPTGHEKTPLDRKSGKAVAKQITERGRSTPASKTSPTYWAGRIYKPTFTRAGTVHETPHYTARIGHFQRRHAFPLGTGNKDAAARKAAAIYSDLITKGWDATLAEHSPKHAPRPERPVTVGDYIREAETVAEVSADTFAGYCRAFRRLVSDIAGIDPTVTVERSRRVTDPATGKKVYTIVRETKDARHDYASEGRKGGGARTAWLAKVEAVPLERITPDKIQRWKVGFVKERASEGPLAERTARGTVNTVLRNARGLFSKAIMETVAKTITLPSLLPFDGEKIFFKKSQLRATRYTSKIDAARLVRLAMGELREQDPDAFAAFLLALLCGMRRKEIDALQWEAVDFAAGTIYVEPTDFGGTKSAESEGWVHADPELIEFLKSVKADARGPFVVESATPPRRSKGAKYRAEETFQKLIEWLRSKGVADRKPLHTLRKECGTHVYEAAGLFAASRHLRHSDTRVTANFYADHRERVSTGLGAILSGADEGGNVVDFEDGRDAG